MKTRSEDAIKADIALKKSSGKNSSILFHELQMAVVARLKAEVRAGYRAAKEKRATA